SSAILTPVDSFPTRRSSDLSSTTDTTNTSTTTTDATSATTDHTATTTATSSNNYTALADSFRTNSAAGNYLDPKTGKSMRIRVRSEEHTSELQSRSDLVCRL